MTALLLPAPTEGDAVRKPLPWRRMAWVTWRQHRFALTTMAALLGALAVGLWALGLQLHSAYSAATACRPASSPACLQVVSHFDGLGAALTTGYVLQAVPALIGAFVGAPVLARELETGTFRYTWAQGFGAWRWAVAKLVALATAVAVAAGLFSVVVSWYYQPYFHAGNQALGLIEESPLAPGLFDLRGLGLAAWSLVALSIGALAGVVARRVVPAIVATLVAYTGLAFVAALYVRPHYIAPLTTNSARAWSSPGLAWILRQVWSTQAGRPVSQSVLGRALQSAPSGLAGKGGIPRAFSSAQYLMQHGYKLLTTYQPVNRFWAFQWAEAAWLVALSTVLIAASTWLVRRLST